PDRQATLSFAFHKARVPTPVASHLCVNGAAIDERPSKGFAVARTCTHANNGGLHTGGSVSETGSIGGNDAAETADGALQGDRRTDRVPQPPTIMRSGISHNGQFAGSQSMGLRVTIRSAFNILRTAVRKILVSVTVVSTRIFRPSTTFFSRAIPTIRSCTF